MQCYMLCLEWWFTTVQLIKTHLTVHLEWIYFIVCKFPLIKLIFKGKMLHDSDHKVRRWERNTEIGEVEGVLNLKAIHTKRGGKVGCR